MSTLQRDLLAIAITAAGFWLLRKELFGREPEEHQAAALHPPTDVRLGVGPGEDAPSRPETFKVGDRVVIDYGPGTVVKVYEDDTGMGLRPLIVVRADIGQAWFRIDTDVAPLSWPDETVIETLAEINAL